MRAGKGRWCGRVRGCTERRKLRMEVSVPILMGFEAWLQAEYPKVRPKSPIGKAINFALERYDRLSRYVIDGRYRIDSNLVENGQRPVALGRFMKILEYV